MPANIPNTWDAVKQPSDDAVAGDVWFWKETYRGYQEGLEIALEEFKKFEEIASQLKLESSPFEKDLDRLQRLVSWGEDKLNDTHPDVRIGGASFLTLRYLKAGALLRAQRLIENRMVFLRQNRIVPNSLLKAYDQKIEQALNMAELGMLKGLKPAELFFEVVPDEPRPTEDATQSRLVGLLGGATYESELVVVDPALRERCLNILNTLDEKGLVTQFDTVIREMSVILEDRIRQLTGSSEKLSGAELISAAMGGEKPRIRFSDRKDLQESAHLLFRGYSGFIRNEVMHKLVPSFTRQRVSQLLAMVDYLLDLLSTAKIPTRIDKVKS